MHRLNNFLAEIIRQSVQIFESPIRIHSSEIGVRNIERFSRRINHRLVREATDLARLIQNDTLKRCASLSYREIFDVGLKKRMQPETLIPTTNLF